MHTVASLIVSGSLVALMGFGWGYRCGAHFKIQIMRDHFEAGETFEYALEYEEAVMKGEVPHA